MAISEKKKKELAYERKELARLEKKRKSLIDDYRRCLSEIKYYLEIHKSNPFFAFVMSDEALGNKRDWGHILAHRKKAYQDRLDAVEEYLAEKETIVENLRKICAALKNEKK